MKRAWTGVLWLAVAAAPWLAGLTHPFLYDDVGMIVENEFLAEPGNVVRVVTGQTLADPDVVNGRRPAVLASYFLDRAVYGLRPAGWRVTSLLLHLGCAGLLAGLLRRLGAAPFTAAGAGLLFALQPALTEAVHAPGFRADVLCLLFMLLALHGFVSVRHGGWIGTVGGLAALALALLAKETALALPLLLAVLVVLFPEAFPESRRARAGLAAAGGALAIGFLGLWVWLPTDMQALGGSWNGESLVFPETVWSAPVLWIETWHKLLVPWPLNVTPAFEPVTTVRDPRFWAGLAAAGGCAAAAWSLRRRGKWITLGLAWMGVFFLPVSNLLPLLHPVAERYLYPIAPGFALAAAWGLARLPGRGRQWALAGLAVLGAVLILLRKAEWRSAETLWSSAFERNPGSATAAVWLGLLREDAGDAESARRYYRAAAAANPCEVGAWINWGILEGRQKNWEESERLLRQALAVRPDSEKALHNLAVCLRKQGRGDEAEARRGSQGRPNP